MKRILIIEDDKSISELQKDYLEMSGYEVVCAFDGNSGLEYIKNEDFDLIILDLMLPKKDGFDILREISDTKQIPVLIVSAKSDEIFKIKGLNLGADDYITKPFGMGELVARVNSHIKTYERFKNSSKRKLITVGALSINKEDRRVYIDDNEVFLTLKEFDLLLFLVENPNRVFSKEELFERVWGYDSLSDASTITVHIARIREKIETNPEGRTFIETVWGAGYRFKI
ncbi:winged helix family two component transcriptional regulator [Keratinibaculum paraultunense]|uniref:Winged helix family two component transcriptional regulator n=1 Tax=Keratinibaculum paraultunense TaxID=1278232 RepID=A0A4R3KSZ1_9FIRM|nr:response regulator transcription factor [Keratinibaculum paraultunense]QQY79526.1 response regulator transcription factor [Keratinibaculum paraultunense]TCS87978.1 winged helix family two component transcriptional regulator [Keratinibaculum paraultunense]